MAYSVVLGLHSWNRWVVLLVGVVLLAEQGRARRWRDLPSDWAGASRLHYGFLRLVDIQFTLGLILYLFLSPWPRAALGDLGSALGNPALRFFSIEHVFGMVLAVGCVHQGHDRLAGLWKRSKQGSPPDRDVIERAELRAMRLQIAWLAITLISIPWPWFDYGRPLMRLGF